ncbi:TonB-dependent siderophore receptor [Psychromonas sp. psych-6C06]|uniref:TonB-dependent siderophore receptor n=1 Tax=Psychromonas sp. psych-6C06 TaxID=2058089 RepID=UPI000C3310BA|nr:TonB-dependent siderophore receptor [Psychromonas sp. psych-6C06]PKF63313.1 TonB-dependent siderophore receptor [Psychromonas sp. psych-6C06]
MFKKSQLALLVGSALASSFATANTEQVDTENSVVDERMVVTGTKASYKTDSNTGSMRMEMTQLETPGQVTVIDEQIIDEQRASTLGQVLKNDSSISAEGNSRNRERFSLRGFQLSSSSGFLRDGKQHWSHYRQPIELLESVEVLKGPAGLLYGKSAPGGLVNMITKKPTAETQLSFSQDIGSDNEIRSTLDVSGSLNESQSLRSRLVLSKQDSESWRTYSDGSSPKTDRFVGGLFVDYDLSDNLTVSVHYDKTIDDSSVDSGAYVKDGEVVLGDDYIWDAQWSNIKNDVQNVGIDVDAQLSTDWSLNVSYNHQNFKRHDVESYPKEEGYDPATGTYSHSGSDRSDHWVFQTASVDLVGDFETAGLGHQFLVGTNWLGYSYDRLQYSLKKEQTTVGQPTASPEIDGSKDPRISDSSYDTYGFYVQDMLTINDSWQVLAGVRYDQNITHGKEGEADYKEDAIVPKLALIYHPASNGSIYLTYSESFEPQGEISDANAINDGQKLDPLTGKLYELGSKWELFDNQLFVSGALFEITQENSVINVDLGNDMYEATQAGERVHRGAELALQGYLTENFSMSGSGTYLDAEYTVDENYQGNRPADVPEFSASIWSRYEFVNNTDVNLGAIYVGSRFGDSANTFKKDAYTRFDFGVAHNLKYDQDLEFVFRLNIENIFDTGYYAGGGSTGGDYQQNGAQNVVIGEGRNFMATVQVRY